MKGVVIMLLFCLVLILMEKTNGLPNQDGLSNELSFIHQEIGLLRDENQDQNREIDLLKEIIIRSYEKQQRSQDPVKDSHFGFIHKRPARLLPIQLLYNRNIKNDMPRSASFYGPPHNCSELRKLGYTLNGFYHVIPLISNSSSTDEFSQLETVHCLFKQPGGVVNESNVEKRILPKKGNGIPTSCRDLKLLGHKLNGLYLIKTSQPKQGKKIETVYCDFQSPTEAEVVQEPIGTVDVKTKIVHFYVQKNFSFDDSIITFEMAKMNEGNAFNLTSGIFTVPVSGIYHFDLSAVKSKTAEYLHIYLQVNGASVGTALTSQNITGSIDVVSLSASLRLAAGDKVNLHNNGYGRLYDDDDHQTHFRGWLVEEDLM